MLGGAWDVVHWTENYTWIGSKTYFRFDLHRSAALYQRNQSVLTVKQIPLNLKILSLWRDFQISSQLQKILLLCVIMNVSVEICVLSWFIWCPKSNSNYSRKQSSLRSLTSAIFKKIIISSDLTKTDGITYSMAFNISFSLMI